MPKKVSTPPTLEELGLVLANRSILIGVILTVEPKVSLASGTPYIICKTSFSDVDETYITLSRFLLTRWREAGFLNGVNGMEDFEKWAKGKHIECRMKTEEYKGQYYIRLDPIKPVWP